MRKLLLSHDEYLYTSKIDNSEPISEYSLSARCFQMLSIDVDAGIIMVRNKKPFTATTKNHFAILNVFDSIKRSCRTAVRYIQLVASN